MCKKRALKWKASVLSVNLKKQQRLHLTHPIKRTQSNNAKSGSLRLNFKVVILIFQEQAEIPNRNNYINEMFLII